MLLFEARFDFAKIERHSFDEIFALYKNSSVNLWLQFQVYGHQHDLILLHNSRPLVWLISIGSNINKVLYIQHNKRLGTFIYCIPIPCSSTSICFCTVCCYFANIKKKVEKTNQGPRFMLAGIPKKLALANSKPPGVFEKCSWKKLVSFRWPFVSSEI